jgi:hypothetical protein
MTACFYTFLPLPESAGASLQDGCFCAKRRWFVARIGLHILQRGNQPRRRADECAWISEGSPYGE